MTAVLNLLAKAMLLTAVFGLLFAATLFASALIFQSHIHPDNWTTTPYDLVAGTIVVALYLTLMARLVFTFIKARQR